MVGVMLVAAATAVAGPTAIGSLVGSRNATLDGQAPLPHTTMLSGDDLQVNDGLAIVALDQGNRMILGRGTEASFSREADGVTVSLARGNVSLYHSEEGSGFRVKAGDVTVAPAKGYRTLGEVAMADGLLLVTAKTGTLQVEKGGATQEVTQGKTITLATNAAGAPAPVPPKRHIKHILFPEGTPHITAATPLVVTAIVAAGAATTLSVIALTRSNTAICETGVLGNAIGQVSPTKPSFSSCQ
jgi:hypothetical protein